MEVKAKLRHLHIAPRKVRLVIDSIRREDTNSALAKLVFTQKRAAKAVADLLKSAVANAEHNFDLDKNNLYIKEIRADGGPTLKRWQPRAFGRAFPILKRTTHVSLILEEKVPGLKRDKKVKPADFQKMAKPRKQEPSRLPSPSAKITEEAKEHKVWDSGRQTSRNRGEQIDKKELHQKKTANVLKRFFQRKSV